MELADLQRELLDRPSTSASTITSRIPSGRTGEAEPPSWSHARHCALEEAITIRPSPTHAWAAEHIGQCSAEV